MGFENLITEFSFLSDKQYHIDRNGVHTMKFADETWTMDKTICAMPILPTALLDNPDDAIQKVEISYWDMNRWKKQIVPRETLTNKSKITALANYGISVGSNNATPLAKYFNDLLGQFGDQIPRKTALSHLGWIDVETETGTDKVYAPYTDRVVFDGQSDNGILFKSISRKGDRSEWIKTVGELRKNIPMRLTLAASFASPLVEIVGENPFILHLWGGTGSGKTVALLVAMSVWGNPKMGRMTRTLNMTVNSMLSTAAFLNSFPFAGDELQTIKTRWGNYDNIVMCLTEGVNRSRMKFDKLMPTLSWNCAFLFTGEEPCIKEESGGGAVNRVIQIEATEQIVEDGNGTASFVKENYGHVGEEYIGVVRNIKDVVKGFYKDTKKQLLEASNTTEKQAGAMALLMTADYLASNQFWDSEKQLSIDDVKQYLADVSTVDQSERAWNFVCGMIAQFGANFEAESRETWGKIEHGEVYILKTVLTDRMTKAGFDFDACKRNWSKKGYVKRDKHGRVQHYISIGGKSAYCVCLIVPSVDSSDVEMTDYTGQLPF